MKFAKATGKERNALVSDSINHPKERCAGCVCDDHRSEDCFHCAVLCDVNNAATVRQVITKLEASKMIAARTPGWKGDEAVLEGYIRKIRQLFNGTIPPPDKAWAWLSGLEKVAESYR
jgi:hypothetical protein